MMHYCSLLLPDTGVSFIRSPRKERQGGRERGNENDSEGEGEGEGEGRWGRRSRRGSGRPRERERERESGCVGGVPLKAPNSTHGLIQYVAQTVGNCSV